MTEQTSLGKLKSNMELISGLSSTGAILSRIPHMVKQLRDVEIGIRSLQGERDRLKAEHIRIHEAVTGSPYIEGSTYIADLSPYIIGLHKTLNDYENQYVRMQDFMQKCTREDHCKLLLQVLEGDLELTVVGASDEET